MNVICVEYLLAHCNILTNILRKIIHKFTIILLFRLSIKLD
jgi:hypothetical protein